MAFLLSSKLRVSCKIIKLYFVLDAEFLQCEIKNTFFQATLTLGSGWKMWRLFVPLLMALKDTGLLSDLCLTLKMLGNNRDILERGFREQHSQRQVLSHCKAGSSGVLRVLPQVLPICLTPTYQIGRKPASLCMAEACASLHLQIPKEGNGPSPWSTCSWSIMWKGITGTEILQEVKDTLLSAAVFHWCNY